MIEQMGITTAGNVKQFRGLSTDTKITQDVGSGSVFREVDTGKIFEFSAVNINPLTEDGWWEVV